MISASAARVRPFTVVVGIDFSDFSGRAVAAALTLARLSPKAEVHLVHAVALPISQAEMVLSTEEVASDFARTRARLEKLAPSELLAEGTTLKVLVASGVPGLVLTSVAREHGADLIVVGTHGASAIGRVLFGSVADYVARNAPCSVLTVRPRELTGDEMIEPPCAECVAIAALGDPTHRHCARHSRRPIHAHTYSDLTEAFSGGSMSYDFSA